MQKVSIRPILEEDADFLVEMMKDKQFQKHYLERLLLRNTEEAKKEIRNSIADAKKGRRHYFTVLLGKEKIGILDIYKISKKDRKASIGYALEKKRWGKGLGTKVCKKGLWFMKKKLKLHAAEATAEPKNAASKKVLEKNGFEHVGTLKGYYSDRGKFVDRELYWKIL